MSRADHRLIARPPVGPALDIPLCLYFCDEHRDVESLVDRYLELTGAVLVGDLVNTVSADDLRAGVGGASSST